MKSILKEIYFGNIVPNQKSFNPNSDYGKAVKTLVDKEEKLLEVLNGSEKFMFNEFSDAQSKITVLTATDNFSYGFKLGALLMAEVFCKEI